MNQKFHLTLFLQFSWLPQLPAYSINTKYDTSINDATVLGTELTFTGSRHEPFSKFQTNFFSGLNLTAGSNLGFRNWNQHWTTIHLTDLMFMKCWKKEYKKVW